MAALKGHKKAGGRQKGTPNRKTETWETFAAYCIEGGLERFRSELEKLKGKQYVDAYLTLLEYHKPKLARVEKKSSGTVHHEHIIYQGQDANKGFEVGDKPAPEPTPDI